MSIKKAIKLLEKEKMTSKDLNEAIDLLHKSTRRVRAAIIDQEMYLDGSTEPTPENFEATRNNLLQAISWPETPNQ